MKDQRYEIRTGKFGQYFYDSAEEKDMGLADVLYTLNKMEQEARTAPLKETDKNRLYVSSIERAGPPDRQVIRELSVEGTGHWAITIHDKTRNSGPDIIINATDVSITQSRDTLIFDMNEGRHFVGPIRTYITANSPTRQWKGA